MPNLIWLDCICLYHVYTWRPFWAQTHTHIDPHSHTHTHTLTHTHTHTRACINVSEALLFLSGVPFVSLAYFVSFFWDQLLHFSLCEIWYQEIKTHLSSCKGLIFLFFTILPFLHSPKPAESFCYRYRNNRNLP